MQHKNEPIFREAICPNVMVSHRNGCLPTLAKDTDHISSSSISFVEMLLTYSEKRAASPKDMLS